MVLAHVVPPRLFVRRLELQLLYKVLHYEDDLIYTVCPSISVYYISIIVSLILFDGLDPTQSLLRQRSADGWTSSPLHSLLKNRQSSLQNTPLEKIDSPVHSTRNIKTSLPASCPAQLDENSKQAFPKLLPYKEIPAALQKVSTPP